VTGFDVLMVLGFGGPEAPQDVLPFMRRVTAGRGIPDARLEEVGRHYLAFGGRSPINAQHRALARGLAERLDRPVVVANRNSPPFVPEVLAGLAGQGVRRVLVLATAAFASYSSCRQYRENLAAGLPRGMTAVKLPPFPELPGLAQALAEPLAAAARPGQVVFFAVHSLPAAMAAAAGPAGGAYVDQQAALARRVMALAGLGAGHGFQLVYQSRSGPPHAAWLEPDVNDALEQAALDGAREVLVVPVSFLTDHMEVMWDLDTQAAATARRLGLGFRRLPTPGASPLFLDGLAEWVGRHLDGQVRAPRPGEPCFGGCCLGAAASPPAVDAVMAA
jgi:ferrochelatase